MLYQYANADWVRSVDDRKSTSGYFTFVRVNSITWKSKIEKVVSLSSIEAEIRGMTKGLCELLWLKRLLTKIGIAPSYYKKKGFHWLFLTIKVGHICKGKTLFIYVIYVRVKKSLKLIWHIYVRILYFYQW